MRHRIPAIGRSGFEASAWTTLVLLCVLGFLVLYPIATVISLSLHPRDFNAGPPGLDAWREALALPRVLEAIWNTVKVVLVTQAIALPVAVGIAWLLARTDLPFGRAFEFCFWVVFFLPALGVTTGWMLLFDAHYGLANTWLTGLGIVGRAPFDMFSFWGIVFAHLTTYGIAVKVMLLTPAFRNLDGAMEEASRVCGASVLRTLARVVVPVVAPAIVVVLLMSTIRGFESFEIELFLGTPIDFPVYSTLMYRLIAADSPGYARAAVLATSILVMMLPLLIAQRWASTRRSYAVVSGRSSDSKTELGRWRWPVFALVALVVCCTSILPLALLVAGSFMRLFGFFGLPEVWTLHNWSVALADSTFNSGLSNMLVLGAGTALAAVLVYPLIGYVIVRLSNRFQAPLDIVTWLPITIPGLILSYGYLYMALRVPLIDLLYGTIAILVLVSFLGAMTLGVQVAKVNMLQIGAEVEEAGRVAGGSWARTFRWIVTPLAAPAVAVIAVMVFASTIRQVGSLILLSTGEIRVLAILQIEFLVQGSLGPASVVGTVIMLISLAAALIVRIVSARFGLAGVGAHS